MLMAAEQVRWIPISSITGWQESEETDEHENQGATVLLCENADGGYTLLAGRERLCELKRLGQSCVDAVVQGSLEAKISTLLSRLTAGTMHYLDEAEAYRELLDTGLSRQELAARVGRSQEGIRKKLRLLELEEETQVALRENQLAEGYAHAVLRMPSPRGRLRVLRQIVEQRLTVRDTEAIVEEALTRMPIPVPRERRLMPAMRDHRLYVNAIRAIVEQMREAGISADMQLTTSATLVEVRVTVPRFGKR